MSADKLKWRINRAVRTSNLPSSAKLIMLTLSDRANVDTAAIPEKNSPSLKDLAEETSLNKATVSRYLPELERLGWVVRALPDSSAQARHDKTGYQLAVGREVVPGDFELAKSGSRDATPKLDSESRQTTPPESRDATPDSGSESRGATTGVGGGAPPPGGGGGGAPPPPPPPPPHRAESRDATPYLKDDDRNDRDDLKKAADAAAPVGGVALFEPDVPAAAVETEGQKVNRLSRIFTDRHMANFKAVSGVVRAAVRRTNPDGTRTYTDRQLADGMAKLADDGWTPTLNTLRIAIEGVPRQRKPDHEGFKNPDPSEYHGTF